MTKIKVVHICTSKIGGAGNAAYRLHLALNDTKIISSKFLYKNQEICNIENEQSISEKKHLVYHRLSNKLGYPILKWHKNRKIIDNYGGNYEKISFPENDFEVENHPWVQEADILHLHWVADFINYPTFFQTLKYKPIVWTFHDMNPFKGLFHYEDDEISNQSLFGRIDSQVKKEKANAILQCQNLTLVSPSKWLADIAKKSNLFRNKEVNIIPYSLPNPWFTLKDRKTAQKRFQLNPKLLTILFISLDIKIRRKGLDLLLEALEIIPNDNVQLLVIGDKEFKLGNIPIVKTGFISNEEDMMLAYAASDVFVIPSREDNLPNVLLEAFAQGIPVISFKNGGMMDWIRNGFNGYLCESITAKSLSKEIDKFIKEKEFFNRITINEFAKSNFNSFKQASSYAEIYNRVL